MKNVLWIPAQALFESDGRTYVYARTPQGGFATADVKLVRRSESQVVITGLHRRPSRRLARPDKQATAKKEKKAGSAVQAIAAMSVLRYLADMPLAFDNLRAQKTRTVLTALGIVFGVGSVIGMLAIGAGAKEESLSFIERLGVRNVLVESIPSASDRNCSSAAGLRLA